MSCENRSVIRAKKSAMLIFAAMFLVFSGAYAWEELIVEGRGVKAIFPHEPKEQELYYNPGTGTSQIITYYDLYYNGRDSIEFILFLNANPVAAVDEKLGEQFLDIYYNTGIISEAESKGDEIVKEKDIAYDLIQGKEFIIRHSTGGLTYSRLYMDGETVFETKTVNLTSDTITEEMTKFIDSFEFLR